VHEYRQDYGITLGGVRGALKRFCVTALADLGRAQHSGGSSRRRR
jgi:hypothetical protein